MGLKAVIEKIVTDIEEGNVSIVPPEELAYTMKYLASTEDKEQRHRAMDWQMEHLLRALGYEEAMDIFAATAKWYA